MYTHNEHVDKWVIPVTFAENDPVMGIIS